MFTSKDLLMLRDRGISMFNNIPYRCRLPGMLHDLNVEEKRLLALYEASLILAFSKVGRPIPEDVLAALPKVFTEVQEVIEGG